MTPKTCIFRSFGAAVNHHSVAASYIYNIISNNHYRHRAKYTKTSIPSANAKPTHSKIHYYCLLFTVMCMNFSAF